MELAKKKINENILQKRYKSEYPSRPPLSYDDDGGDDNNISMEPESADKCAKKSSRDYSNYCPSQSVVPNKFVLNQKDSLSQTTKNSKSATEKETERIIANMTNRQFA
ncbi:uncharacterized protein LOC117180327 [Belonocnema kinseyi]|uniref:uncharacterized protein LOC117180327 n=1 Tax=Belonocnema kinseyi TaxID=2817044 RepID=UPI00143DBCA8|nr:uncharacterized protein LOC117180327 [Belonocnema kinseyi]